MNRDEEDREERRGAPGGRAIRWRKRAAVLLAAAAIAGAAYAIPGSPVRGWIHDILEKHGLAPVTSRRVVAPPPPASGPSGIAVAPGRRLLIDIAPARGGTAHVSWTDGTEVEVEATAAAASFTSGAGHLLIVPRESSGRFQVRIPRSAASVEIRVNGARVFLAEGGRVTTQAARLGDAWSIRF